MDYQSYSENELNSASEHLLYEIEMFYYTAHFLITPIQDKDTLQYISGATTTDISRVLMAAGNETQIFNLVQKNALVESFGIHYRELYDFLGKHDRYHFGDIRAKHFIDNNNIINTLKSKIEALAHNPTMVNKTIAHLTIERIMYKNLNYALPVAEIVKEMVEPLNLFIKHAKNIICKNEMGDFIVRLGKL